jgi:hypothetical protein
MPWNFEGASCWGIETNYFFPEKNQITEENKQAKKICNGCNWKKECLTYALHYKVVGVWGGKSNREREAIRKQLNIIAKPITSERYVA